jgi:hypothetical protein
MMLEQYLTLVLMLSLLICFFGVAFWGIILLISQFNVSWQMPLGYATFGSVLCTAGYSSGFASTEGERLVYLMLAVGIAGAIEFQKGQL